MKVNYIDISGYVKTLPKDATINGILYGEFLLSAQFFYDHAGNVRYENFQIPVIAFRKYFKKCTCAFKNGKSIRIKGGLSCRPNDRNRIYQGIYICADKITIG